MGKIERTFGKENDRPERPEKPERRPNSKELIEKQRNWTSHFSKTRPSRYNSDPNRSLVQTSLNSQNAQNQVQSSSVDCQNSASAGSNDTASPARSASFCSARSPPPPLPPVRNSSAAGRRERPASIAAVSPSELPESPEYATVERFDDISPTIPEYAVVQKTKKPQDGAKETQDSDKTPDALPEYAVVQKPSSKAALKSKEENSKEAPKLATQNLKGTAAAEAAPASKIVTPRSAESAKDVPKTGVQNLKDSASAEAIPRGKTVISKTTDSAKEISKISTQTLKGTSIAEDCKSAASKLAEGSKETTKEPAVTEGTPVFKSVISRPADSGPKEAAESTRDVTKAPTVAEATSGSKTVSVNECSDVSEHTRALPAVHCEVSSPTRSVSMDNMLIRRESDCLEAPEYLNYPPSPIHSPAKTSQWRNEWLAKNDEILKRTVDLRDLKSSSREALEADVMRSDAIRPDPRPDWARPNAKKKEITVEDKRVEPIRSPESELGLPSAGTDSASSSMSSPSSPSKDSKEEKAEKEMPEKHQTGKSLAVCVVCV